MRLVLLSLLAFAFAAQPLLGKNRGCFGGREYVAEYSALFDERLTITRLDTVEGLLGVVCNVDESDLLLVFQPGPFAQAFVQNLNPVTSIVTAGVGACNESSSPFMLRVLDYEIETFSSGFTSSTFSSTWSSQQPAYVFLNTAATKYTEVFNNATISFGATGNSCGVSDTTSTSVCLGVNTNKQCNAAAEEIPIYSDSQITVSCSNCFIALQADLFLEVNIEFFYMTSFSGGFENVAAVGSLVVDLSAQDSWSVGVDKTYPVVTSDTIVDFWIGPVPIHIWFSLPLELQFDSTFQTSGKAQVGADIQYDIGGLSVAWDWKSGWSMVKPTPQLTTTPVLSGEANFNAENTLQLLPSFIINADSFFSASFNVSPMVSAQTTGSTESSQICTDVSWNLGVTAEADLNINIPWFAIHKSKSFGPYTVYESGTQNLPQFCVDV
jgi:hypothetical protein